jgi:hypothetical protein
MVRFSALLVLSTTTILISSGCRSRARDEYRAEGLHNVSVIARDAQVTFVEQKHLCKSHPTSVPASAEAVRGKIYVATKTDWESAADVGFPCLGFSLEGPQRYRYSYEATDTSFVVTAEGDFDGNGKTARYTRRGRVVAGHVEIDDLEKVNPEE